MEEKVTITKKEYKSLLDDIAFLEALECCDVADWSGYEVAREMYENREED